MDIIKQFLCIIHARLGPVAGGWLAGCNGDNPSWLINSIPRNLAREIWAEPSWAVLCCAGWAGWGQHSNICFAHLDTKAGGWRIRNISNILEMKHWLRYYTTPGALVPSPGGCGVNHHLDAALPWQGFLGWSRCAHCAESPLSAANKNVAAGDLNQDPGLATLHPTTHW